MNELLRYKNVILFLVIIIVFVIVGKNINDHYTQQKLDLEVKEAELQQGKKTMQRWENLGGEYSRITLPFFKGDVLPLKTLVEEKAKDNEVEIVSLSVRTTDEDFYWVATIKVNFVCPYMNFLRFIDSLEEKSIAIKTIRIKESEGQVEVNADLEGIVLK